MKHLKYIAAVAGVLAVSMINSQALSYSAATDGITAPSGVTFSAIGGSLGLKTQGPTTILGVSGGGTKNEIDPGQALKVSFSTPQNITSLSIGLLFDGPEYGDVDEIAGIIVNNSGSLSFTLQASTGTIAIWDGSGTVTNISPATLGLGGEWLITDPFGYLLVSELYFYPVAHAGQTGSPSDFGLSGFTTPDSGSMAAMLGLSLLAIGVTSHLVRRRTA